MMDYSNTSNIQIRIKKTFKMQKYGKEIGEEGPSESVIRTTLEKVLNKSLSIVT